MPKTISLFIGGVFDSCVVNLLTKIFAVILANMPQIHVVVYWDIFDSCVSNV